MLRLLIQEVFNRQLGLELIIALGRQQKQELNMDQMKNYNSSNQKLEHFYYQNMNELGITKVMDGIFISDMFVVQDQQFLVTNKVSHVVIWASQNILNLQEIEDVKYLILNHKQNQSFQNAQQPKQLALPQKQLMQKIFQFIEESKQQCLCCLICSDIQSQAAMLLSHYIMKKFNWDLKTTFNFIQIRFNFFEPLVEIVQQLQDLQLHVQSQKSPQMLKSIEFNYEFLSSYLTQDTEEKLLLNTIKNMSIQNTNPQKTNNIIKQRRRVRWQDRIRPQSSLKKINCKYTVYKRHSSLKSKLKIPQNQNIIQQHPNQKNQQRIKIAKYPNLIGSQELFVDQFQFKSLQQMSKQRKIQKGLKGYKRKNTSLKLFKAQKQNLIGQGQNLKGQIYNNAKKSQINLIKRSPINNNTNKIQSKSSNKEIINGSNKDLLSSKKNLFGSSNKDSVSNFKKDANNSFKNLTYQMRSFSAKELQTNLWRKDLQKKYKNFNKLKLTSNQLLNA